MEIKVMVVLWGGQVAVGRIHLVAVLVILLRGRLGKAMQVLLEAKLTSQAVAAVELVGLVERGKLQGVIPQVVETAGMQRSRPLRE